MNDRGRNENGLSDALGAVVLISVVALGTAIVGIAILSGPLPDRIPAMSVDVTNTSGYVFIRHTGGDTLVQGEYRILVDGIDRTSQFLSGGARPAQWSVGNTLEYQVPSAGEIPDSILIVAITANGDRAIQQVQVQPPAVRPSSSISPTATTTVTSTTVTATQTAVPPPAAGFSGNPTSGTRPLVVRFTDSSTGSPSSWSWDFGDGSVSALQNPSHTYTMAGTYSVTLAVTNAGGSDSEIRTNYISVTDPPTTSPTPTPTTTPTPLPLVANFDWKEEGSSGNVQFTDKSTGSPASWQWNFDDGSSSALQNPKHKFKKGSSYDVTLTITRSSDGAVSSTSRQVRI